MQKDIEQHLIEDCKRNKAKAQKQIYDLCAPRMLALCTRYVGDRDVACDILQDGFIKLFTKIEDYKGGSFMAWARSIFVNTALGFLREQDMLKFAENIEDFSENIEDENITAVSKISEKELMNCIAALPEGYRTVFNLFVIEGYSHAEIAVILNIEETSSRSQYSRARKLLREKIEEYG